jgi:formylglycine-generating enzyme required for sulfatase activity
MICEVWNQNDRRWMLVDPTMGMVDFSREKFDFSNDAWLKMQKKEIDPKLFGMPGQYPGVISIIAKVFTDLAFLLGNEYPVSQYAPVLDDAKAFAEWMGCRLPTEAEWEYAARANTTTPFYSGDCITSVQANFNGNEPYNNCEKSESRKKLLPVGSFAPNNFGLYDMHGNIWQWTNDWYGEYNLANKLNPNGPDTGTNKVDRGGGFYDPAWRCRSAYRAGGDPPGNRGTGIGFRIVKD